MWLVVLFAGVLWWVLGLFGFVCSLVAVLMMRFVLFDWFCVVLSCVGCWICCLFADFGFVGCFCFVALL